MWVVDWPMFEWNEEESRWDPLHHPFTAPQGEFDPERPGEALAAAYDIVWNGQELGGGSIRIADRALQERVFETIGIGADEAQERFGFLLEALRYGAPPHGGIAYGLDRIVQRLVGADSTARRDRLPEDGLGRRPAHRGAGTCGRGAAPRAGDSGSPSRLIDGRAGG